MDLPTLPPKLALDSLPDYHHNNAVLQCMKTTLCADMIVVSHHGTLWYHVYYHVLYIKLYHPKVVN